MSSQISMIELGLWDEFDCSRCAWQKAYGYCYPKETLRRQYFYESKGERRCSDYGTKFASVPRKAPKE